MKGSHASVTCYELFSDRKNCKGGANFSMTAKCGGAYARNTPGLAVHG
jgi:hypothetical protein